MPLQKSEVLLPGSNHKPILLDITFDPSAGKCPAIVYAHGFNGFKDWGNFDLIAARFVTAGFTFIKFNFSHNGTTPEHPQDFTDLESFAENNYTKELYDLDQVISWTYGNDHDFSVYIDTARIGLIGHSMGGGISILSTAADKRIKALVTWASIAECKTPWAHWPQEKIAAWQQEGVAYYLNGRTQQQMPMRYQLYEDFQQYSAQFDILNAAAAIRIPWLICHGTADTSVPVESAYALHEVCSSATLLTLDSDHVFGRKHPWPGNTLPQPMMEVIQENIAFFNVALT